MKRPVPLTACLGVLLLIGGCQPTRPNKDSEETPPFVFRSLDLKQQDPQGRPAWQLSSPEARYDLQRRIARAENPKGVIHRNGQPLYRLEADSGTVISDGEAILLEGHLRVARLSQPPVLIKAERARWLPRQKLLLVDRSPEAYDQRGRLRASRAEFRFDTDTLELKGSPLLERWAKPFNPLVALPKEAPETAVEVHALTWKPSSGELDAAGPVLALRHPDGAIHTSSAQRLSAERLRGNTQSESYSLIGAVRLDDPAHQQQLETRDVQLDLKAQNGSTDQAFALVRGTLKASGTGLRVNGNATTALIVSQCHVEQPGERLEAQQCQWNWGNGTVEARGSVLLQRQANRQISRAQQLQGRLGPEGTITIRSPGGRVESRFQVPSRRP